MRLLKGFEIEMYTGTPQGEIVGLSDKIVEAMPSFMREPDSRNVEYVTKPLQSFEQLLCALVRPRQELRKYLKQLGDYTLIPGSTLSLGRSDRFFRSDPKNPYHDYIENTYGTKVVTASVHINVGISDPETLMRACRVIRTEAPLFLALSASSPFIDGKATGYHSTRWGLFPQTPSHVPLFSSHADHIQWVEQQLAAGTMQNVRHLWTSVRPNGDRRPYDLNRLELRICDLVTDPIALLAITALLEARLLQIIENTHIDPLTQSTFTPQELIAVTASNEAAAAANSLDAQLTHWQDGKTIIARDWIAQMSEELWAIAKERGFNCFLSPLQKILREGNEAQQWLQLHAVGVDAQRVITQAIVTAKEREIELEDKLCSPSMA
ncbi:MULTISPECIES: glutamate--cysteine ligase [unclassified Tolypothrix]|uniref:glutamate--cysteine ligase n=1 Tax=unclassified Tolypothrix TaxID=2649714 RepID=UPI0005EAAC22|nr:MULTISPECIES: glutamate--cysteine ligase [unclassified Tolypothrix]BAY94324.1 putative glutamate--cysteine ligase [Microchaete diplosiphon NIES-3275]EKF04097.1 glutamate--cysteine ligase [Tolypothrix sp. PCC 7601]MBE9087255.1 glutamate--cysteine ligase [Tolypothrix sp. LEGE 11397]UYD28055.1 glutamate--cysteine ligase [Tolypothrix sp. PCC 7712]UYD36075.1 glutamate--cysteine ligase [Tolypothrix sp. PCC 7601]